MKTFSANKSFGKGFDGIWGLDLINVVDYGPENNGSSGNVLEATDKISKY